MSLHVIPITSPLMPWTLLNFPEQDRARIASQPHEVVWPRTRSFPVTLTLFPHRQAHPQTVLPSLLEASCEITVSLPNVLRKRLSGLLIKKSTQTLENRPGAQRVEPSVTHLREAQDSPLDASALPILIIHHDKSADHHLLREPHRIPNGLI